VTTGPTSTGLVLFAHGARDARWAEPFNEILKRVRAARPGGMVELAFLELMQPNLGQVVQQMADAGCRVVRVIPLFLGEGAHLRRDLPELIAAISERFPQLDIAVSPAAGANQGVLEALVHYCLAEVAVQ
jgi:sirohydrochlorin cobaltochelatase